MKFISKLSVTLLAVAISIFFYTGCQFNRTVNPLSANLEQQAYNSSSTPNTSKVANVKFVIAGSSKNIRFSTLATPSIMVSLKLINLRNTANPYTIIRKKANLTLNNASYTATTEFIGVPALPSIGKLSIDGGYIASGNTNVSTWTGALDLADNKTNIMTLVPEGGKSAIDVTVNVIEKILESPDNVATIPVSLVTSVASYVSALDLTSSTIYDTALSTFLDAQPYQPSDAEFDIPSGYNSLAYPKSDSTVAISETNFNSNSEVSLILMNRGNTQVNIDWSANLGSTASLRASRATHLQSQIPQLTKEQKFHLMLRNSEHKMPATHHSKTSSIKSSIRATTIGSQRNFFYLDASEHNQTLTAKCVKITTISGTNKSVDFYLDTDITYDSNAQAIINDLSVAWANIYTTDTTIFGSEPTGTINGIDATNFAILISEKITSAGYFYSGDFYTDANARQNGFRSNERKMFYLQYDDAKDSTRTVNDMSATMAHEFQHMIYFNQKTQLQNIQNTSTWLNEAMSGYAEYVNGFQIRNQKNQSRALQANTFFTNISGTGLTTWSGGHSNYGEVYLFALWLVQNYAPSDGNVKALLSSSFTGKEAVANFTGESFDTVFAKFMMALWVNDYNYGGIYGIKGLDLRATYNFGDGWADVSLTGPVSTDISSWVSTNSHTASIMPYSATYIKLTGGNGNKVNISASLPTGSSLFELKRN